MYSCLYLGTCSLRGSAGISNLFPFKLSVAGYHVCICLVSLVEAICLHLEPAVTESNFNRLWEWLDWFKVNSSLITAGGRHFSSSLSSLSIIGTCLLCRVPLLGKQVLSASCSPLLSGEKVSGHVYGCFSHPTELIDYFLAALLSLDCECTFDIL